jgi:hypothetical protein
VYLRTSVALLSEDAEDDTDNVVVGKVTNREKGDVIAQWNHNHTNL